MIAIARNVRVVRELGSWFKREVRERKERDAAWGQVPFSSPAAGRLVTAISARCYYVLKMENYRARWQQKQTYAGRLARTNAYISPRNRGFGRFLTGSQNS